MRVVMGNLGAIYRKELYGYFTSPLAYAIAAIFWLLAGFLLVVTLEGTILQAASWDFQAKETGISLPSLDAPYEFLKTFLGGMGYLSLFILPMLSMGLYAEERKQGTLELLATSPITNWAVATGKLLGVATFFTTMVMPLLLCEAIILSATSPPIPTAVPLMAHFGLILVATSILSLGMFISSLTDSTILAAILTFTLAFSLWIIELIANYLSTLSDSKWQLVGEALERLSLLRHYYNAVTGIFDTSSLIMLASYIVVGVFLTAGSIEVLRFDRS